MKLNDLQDMMCKEMDEIVGKGSLSAGDLDALYKITTTMKNAVKLSMMGMEGNSNRSYRGSYRGGSYDGGSYDGGGYGGGSNRGGSYGGGSYDAGMRESIERMMQNASPRDRETLKRWMEGLG